jgi:hypothetical protein
VFACKILYKSKNAALNVVRFSFTSSRYNTTGLGVFIVCEMLEIVVDMECFSNV